MVKFLNKCNLLAPNTFPVTRCARTDACNINDLIGIVTALNTYCLTTTPACIALIAGSDLADQICQSFVALQKSL